MAGASIARPQDVQSAIHGNPATMSQYRGTNFAISGGWIEPTYNLSVGAPPPAGFGVGTFNNAKSDAQGVAAGNIGLTQDFSALGMDGAEVRKRLYSDARVLPTPGDGLGIGGALHHRFNLGAPKSVIEEAVARIAGAFADLQ